MDAVAESAQPATVPSWSPPEVRSPDEPVGPDLARSEEAENDADFGAVYRKQNSPKILIYATREFSGRVADIRAGIGVAGNVRSQSDWSRDAATGTASDSTEGSLFWVKAVENEPLVFTDDELLFERTFSAELLSGGVRVVDRNIIVRQEAAKHRDVDILKQAVLSEAVVEDWALAHKVDWILTIDMLGSQSSACVDRRYLVAVKELTEGTLIATADSDQARRQFTRTKVVGTSQGYKRRTTTEPYDCDDLARALAQETMAAISRTHG